MDDNRYRMHYGETHYDVRIIDDETGKYIRAFPVELLNEYDKKNKLMEEKLSELGYEIWFLSHIEIQDKDEGKTYYESIIIKNPNCDSVGEWTLLTSKDVKKILKKTKELEL